MAARWLYVRATINMHGLRRGAEAWIDVMQPQFAPLLEHRYLVPVDAPADVLPPDDSGEVVGLNRRPIESEDELPLPDEDDEAAGAPDIEAEDADIDDAGKLDDGQS